MKRFLVAFLTAFGLAAPSAKSSPLVNSKQFIFVKIPESIMPIDQGKKYEYPLDAALKAENLGEVSEGGSQLSKPDDGGK